jgi:hypothetical protein
MFTPDAIIDSVQNAKKQVVNTFYASEEIKTGLNEVIDAQTQFTKTVAKNALLFSQLFVKNFPVGTAK